VIVEPGSSFRIAGFDVRAFEVPHTNDPVSLGYRIESPDGVVVFSGDSAWTEAFVAQTRESDLFLCECCSMQPETKLHTSYEDILANRARLGCARLLLTHLGADVRSASSFDAERAHDGMTVEIVRRARKP